MEDLIARVETALKTSDARRRNVILAALAEISATYLTAEGDEVAFGSLRGRFILDEKDRAAAIARVAGGKIEPGSKRPVGSDAPINRRPQ